MVVEKVKLTGGSAVVYSGSYTLNSICPFPILGGLVNCDNSFSLASIDAHLCPFSAVGSLFVNFEQSVMFRVSCAPVSTCPIMMELYDLSAQQRKKRVLPGNVLGAAFSSLQISTE
jgi:hypothetical protein